MGFLHAFSGITRNIWAGLSTVVKPAINGLLSVTPHIIKASQSLLLIPVIGAAASQIGAAANVVQNVAVTARDLIQVGENYRERKRTAKKAPVMMDPVVQMQPISILPSVTNIPRRLPSAEELLGISVAQQPRVIQAPLTGGLVNSRPILPLPKRTPRMQNSKRILPVNSGNSYMSSIPGVGRRRWATADPIDEVDGLSERLGQLSISDYVPPNLRTGRGVHINVNPRKRGNSISVY